MKIAILGIKGVPGYHGVEVVVDSLLPHFAELGHNITVYGYASYTENMLDYRGSQVKTVSGSFIGSFEMVSHMWKATIDANKQEFDIIHIHSTDPCILAWKLRARYGIIATSHGQAYLRKKWGYVPRNMSKLAERFFIKIPQKTTSVSKPLADYYKDRYNKEVTYIPNGIIIRKKPHVSFLNKWAIRPQEFFFCPAGRFERTKGLHTLFEAYARLETNLPLIIAGGGSGSDKVYFDEIVKSKPDNVILTGFLSGDEFFALYAYARIFIFPSEYEAMSMALLEGLSFGTPTIYSNIPENEFVAKGLGVSFEVSNSDSLTKTIENVNCNYDEAIELGKKAKKVIRGKHDWKKIARQYNEVYMNLAQDYLFNKGL
jgi:glycosyltransferase involved in cell wall biosynthesis